MLLLRVSNRIKYFLFFSAISILAGTVAAFGGEPVQLVTYKTHSRLIFQLDGSSAVKWKYLPDGFEIQIPGLSFRDMSAQNGAQALWRKKLGLLNDHRLTSIRVQENEKGVQIRGKWKFPGGAQTLAHPVMDVFEFHDKASSQYRVDFWVRSGLTLAELKTLEQKQKLEALLKKMKADEQNRVTRKIAGEKRRAEVKDASRFCGQPLSDQNDIFLKFHPTHKKVDFSRWFPTNTADSTFPYFRPQGDSRDNQYGRLAENLYMGGNLGLAIRTVDFLEAEFPHSDFLNEMRFLKANALIRLGHADAGDQILKKMMKELKRSPIALYTAMFIAGRQMKKDAPLIGLENFLWLINNYPDNSLIWVFHLGAAECMYQLQQTERALKEYQWVLTNGPTIEAQAEAAYRIGDLYLQRFEYPQALTAYYQVEHYKEVQSKFPEFVLNRAEVLYQLGEINQAKSEFEGFMRDFPNHSEGWRATFRMAEIAGRNPSAKGQDTPEYRSYLLRTVNRYPTSPGAVLSRIRLIPCLDHGGFDFKTQEKFFFSDAQSFDGDGKVYMKDYPDFRALSHVRSLVTLGTPEEIADMAVHELKIAKAPLVRRILKTVANDFFQKMILQLLAAGKNYEALSVYVAKAPVIPAPEDETELEYLLKLSEAASDLEMGQLADQLLDHYTRLTQSKRPTNYTDIESMLKGFEQDFASAKALWIDARKGLVYAPNIKDRVIPEKFAKIRAMLHLVRGESKYSFEKEIILGILEEYVGNLSAAIHHVSRARLLGKSVRLDSWLADLFKKSDDIPVALSIYKALEVRLRDEKPDALQIAQDRSANILGAPPLPEINAIIQAEAQIYELQNKWGEAAAAYSRMLASGSKSNQVLYEYARTLTKTGDPSKRKVAIETLKQIVATQPIDPNEIFWKKIAAETLANDETHQSIINHAKEGNL